MKPKKTILTLIASGGLLATSQAATLAWSDAAFSDSAQISTTGTQITSYNLGNATDVVVNGVTFTGRTGAGGGAFGDTYLRWGSNDTFTDQASVFYGAALGVTGMTAGDEVALLSSAFYGGAVGAGNQLEGLTIGNTYIVQYLLVDNRAIFAGRTMHFAPDGSTWGPTYDYTSNGATPYARLIETTFVADATTQAYRTGIQGSAEMQTNAFQLREVAVVPEPSSTALIGLGGLALILRRRK